MAKAAKEQAVKYEEMLREVHQAGVVALEAEREEERGRHQEEVERLREDFDTRLHQELEELTQSHKAEVGLLQQQYQTQLDSLTLSHQQNMAQEGAERVAQVHQELERVKEELVEVRDVVEEHRGVLREREEERERLSLQVQAAVSGEKDREDQRDRQHREDTASLAILQKQLSALTNEKEALGSCLVMLQSSVSGCVQLASLVEQTLSPPSSTTTASQLWHTPSAIVQDRGVERSSDVREEGVAEGEEREEDTLTPPPPPPPTTTPAPGHTSGAESVASTGSVMWTKSATNLLSSGSLLRQV
ncbi:hypothetical protein GBAR_LOCUS27993 [Geodia barretti]|uniref:Uncharacterized protein n=1 Tax=Geodia barretti TaxID=519541 RepID=A0AA35TML0_GEOBA|nr:hypothetical protein GBAR_LOCUS27993 [Geodia barretti]